MQREDFYGQADWTAATLLSEDALETQVYNTPKQAPCAANSMWKGNRLLTPAGGGVSISPHLALSPDSIIKDDGRLAKMQRQAAEAVAEDRWWWD